MARSTINMAAMVNANSALVQENLRLRDENVALSAKLEKALSKIAELERKKTTHLRAGDKKTRLTSVTGRINPKSELTLVGQPSFEVFIGGKGKTMRVLAGDPVAAEALRRADPSEVVCLNCRVTFAGLQAINIGTITADLILEGPDRIRKGRNETEIPDDRNVKVWAVTPAGERIKILSLPGDQLAARKLGEHVSLEGAFRSIKIDEKYYDFFLTAARLETELNRLNGMTVVVEPDYVPPAADENPDIAF